MKYALKLRTLACAALAIAAANTFAAGYTVVEFAVKPVLPHGAYTFSYPGALASDGRALINAVTVTKKDTAWSGGEICNSTGDVCKRLAPKDYDAHFVAASPDLSRIAGVAEDGHGGQWMIRFKSGEPEFLLANARANSVNKKNVVVGENAVGMAYRYDDAEQVLPALAGPFNYANSINDAGVVAGEGSTDAGESRAVMWDKLGAVHALQPKMPDDVGHWSVGSFVTAEGTVYGISTFHDRGFVAHAVRFTKKGRNAVSLGALGSTEDGNTSAAISANSQGIAVGRSTNLPLDPGPQAVVFANGTVTELATQIPADARAKFNLAYATRINEAGQILVIGYRKDTGDEVALRLDPQP